MKASVEISLYPLNENYKEIIKNFIEEINRKNSNLKIETNLMSTQIFGDYDEVFSLLKTGMKEVFEKHPAIFVMKFIGKDLTE
ncbi:MAG TPA: YkoF family thiamine/hydroxymethylpyrimidine-binding protein [Ignavibacteriaceae bacterium]|nr:YkoF family thiamine/hydroxymethylpyrimidine-binding protein [Ignavibacteriaceae bacterium]